MGGTYDDAQDPSTPEQSFDHGPHLIVVLECDRPLAGGARFSLAGIERVAIGRGDTRQARRAHGPERTLELAIPGKSVSARHAVLTRVGSEWALEDHGSTNGTSVRGKCVSRCVLGPGELFEVGRVHMRVNPSLATPSDAPPDFDSMGTSDATAATLDPRLGSAFGSLAKIATADLSVLLLGESGTGKEGVARWLHKRSGRTGAFVPVNCGAIPGSLLESSLFGHVKGAFSGAIRDEIGFVRAAEGGTLFLDEIADLRPESQAALLRVLQEREVVPLGGTRAIRVAVRVVAATHQSLDDLVARGAFRADLLARLAGFKMHLPPLRERRDDMGLLIATLLGRAAGDRASSLAFASEAGRALVQYDFPFNIRELEHCLRASVALTTDGVIRPHHLPEAILKALSESDAEEPTSTLSPRDKELRLELLAQLERHAGNLAEIARAMGKARMQVHRWCRRFGVDPNAYRK
jgi:DNA-binding NtrC family response regulator